MKSYLAVIATSLVLVGCGGGGGGTASTPSTPAKPPMESEERPEHNEEAGTITFSSGETLTSNDAQGNLLLTTGDKGDWFREGGRYTADYEFDRELSFSNPIQGHVQDAHRAGLYGQNTTIRIIDSEDPTLAEDIAPAADLEIGGNQVWAVAQEGFTKGRQNVDIPSQRILFGENGPDGEQALFGENTRSTVNSYNVGATSLVWSKFTELNRDSIAELIERTAVDVGHGKRVNLPVALSPIGELRD